MLKMFILLLNKMLHVIPKYLWSVYRSFVFIGFILLLITSNDTLVAEYKVVFVTVFFFISFILLVVGMTVMLDINKIVGLVFMIVDLIFMNYTLANDVGFVLSIMSCLLICFGIVSILVMHYISVYKEFVMQE